MFKTKYTIAFSETDPGGILFFAEFLKIAHITYERFFNQLNLERNYFLDDEYVLPIVHTEADYLSPVKFGDTLDCSVLVKKIGNSSFTLMYKLEKNGIVASEITTTHVTIKKVNFEKTNIPEELLERLKENQH